MKAPLCLGSVALVALFASVSVAFGQEANSSSAAVDAARGLIQRVLPDAAGQFTCEITPASDGHDVYGYAAAPDGKILLRGNNGVSLAVAFDQYLRREAHLDYGWEAVRPLHLDGPLPKPAAPVSGTCAARERFFLNYCTFGYTMPWWGWDQWQRFIDWMAMNGVNRPLLQSGQEAVWLRVWQHFGLTADEIRAYFSGPAHLPWHRMANLDRWGGPLPLSYIEGQQKLEGQILARARSLGMRPILSGFAGHVPPQIARSHPKAKLTRIGAGWGDMPAEYATTYLDPTDPLFAEIQTTFIREQTALYGTDHLYAADPFNEMTPPSLEPAYLAAVAKGIFAGMTAADPEARWYQMAWTFYNDKKTWTVGGRMAALLNAVPRGRLIMLDYVCEEEELYPLTENFYGQPFIWNYLGNFGGNTHLVAPLRKVASREEKALQVPNCAGVGSTLEGINVNPEIYQMLLEQPWHPGGATDVSAWIQDYAKQRAGGADPAVIEAWQMLADKVLVDHAMAINGHGAIVQARPSAGGPGQDQWPLAYSQFNYQQDDLVAAVRRLWDAAPSSRRADGYQYDVVNLTRQALGNYGRAVYERIDAAYARHDMAAFDRNVAEFLQLGRDLDALLGTRPEFLLGKWLGDARRWGRDSAEADYYETEARQIITTWHLPGRGLDDYACRQYNGLVADYYLPRWEKYFALCREALREGKGFPSGVFTAWVNAREDRWVHEHGNPYPAKPVGDPVATAERLFRKYFPETGGS